MNHNKFIYHYSYHQHYKTNRNHWTIAIMANLKQDLDEYLLLQSDQKKSFKIDMKMPTIKLPEIKKLFSNNEPQEANSWLKDTQESCCPKLVRYKDTLPTITA